jgi:cyclic pyranopterin phosphate synthase
VTLSHVDAQGRARMVDVAEKAPTARVALAEGHIVMSPEACAAAEAQRGPKGPVLSTAELAGTMAAKRTADLIPLCHPLALNLVEVTAVLDRGLPGVRVTATVKAVDRTGVEMEALTAVAVALLTIYDMLKAVDRGMEIASVRLLHKSGGSHGEWRRSG